MPKESLLSSMPKLILAVVLIVCVGAVMGLMGYALTKKQTRVETPEVKAPDGIIENDIADWQTYRNEEFNYELKLPSDWKAYSGYDGNIIASSVKEFPNDSLILTGTPPDLNFQVEIIQSMDLKDYQSNFFADVEMIEKLQTETGKTGLKLSNVSENDSIFFLLQINKNLLKIFSNKDIPLNDQIFNSIKFTDQPDIADWQTYRNEEFGFEVEYPNEIIEEEDAVFFTGLIDKDIIVVKILVKRNKSSDDLVSDIEKDIIVQEAGAITSNEMVSFGNTLSRKIVYSLPTGTDRTMYYIERDQDTIEIIWGYYERENIKNIEKILSTFKFIEK